MRLIRKTARSSLLLAGLVIAFVMPASASAYVLQQYVDGYIYDNVGSWAAGGYDDRTFNYIDFAGTTNGEIYSSWSYNVSCPGVYSNQVLFYGTFARRYRSDMCPGGTPNISAYCGRRNGAHVLLYTECMTNWQ